MSVGIPPRRQSSQPKPARRPLSFRRALAWVVAGHLFLIVLVFFWHPPFAKPGDPAAGDQEPMQFVPLPAPAGSAPMRPPPKQGVANPAPAPTPPQPTPATPTPPAPTPPPEPTPTPTPPAPETPPEPTPLPSTPSNLVIPQKPVPPTPPTPEKPKTADKKTTAQTAPPKEAKKPSPATAAPAKSSDELFHTHTSAAATPMPGKPAIRSPAPGQAGPQGAPGANGSGLKPAGVNDALAKALSGTGTDRVIVTPGGGGAGGPGGSGSWYYGLIQKEMYGSWDQPVQFIGKGLSAVVRIEIDADGTISRAEVATGSGNPVFDQSVLAAARSRGRLSKPRPDDIPGTVTITFKLLE